MSKEEQLIELMQQMADLTLPECKHTCALPLSCCSPEYCRMAIQYARDQWGIELQPTDHDRLPLMGAKGCVAAPHLRPLCTLHTCQINSLGCKPNDPQWTSRYFDLRDQIEELMYELNR
jgi:hypothetical protein